MAECGKKDTCKNYGKKCTECWAASSIYNEQPCYTNKDLVEVVRCKDCRWYRLSYLECRHPHFNGIISHEGFCSYGEPKEKG